MPPPHTSDWLCLGGRVLIIWLLWSHQSQRILKKQHLILNINQTPQDYYSFKQQPPPPLTLFKFWAEPRHLDGRDSQPRETLSPSGNVGNAVAAARLPPSTQTTPQPAAHRWAGTHTPALAPTQQKKTTVTHSFGCCTHTFVQLLMWGLTAVHQPSGRLHLVATATQNQPIGLISTLIRKLKTSLWIVGGRWNTRRESTWTRDKIC